MDCSTRDVKLYAANGTEIALLEKVELTLSMSGRK